MMFFEILQTKIRDTNLTNVEFAKLSGIKKTVLNEILNGEKPDKWSVNKIANGLNVDVEEVQSWIPSQKTTVKIPTRKIVKVDFKKKPKSPLKAKGRFCIRCWFNEEIYVYDNVQMCHYTGIRQHAFNKCRGKKGSAILQAPLCNPCHKRFDEPKVSKSVELSEDFLFFIDLFIVQEFEAGNIIIKK